MLIAYLYHSLSSKKYSMEESLCMSNSCWLDPVSIQALRGKGTLHSNKSTKNVILILSKNVGLGVAAEFQSQPQYIPHWLKSPCLVPL